MSVVVSQEHVWPAAMVDAVRFWRDLSAQASSCIYSEHPTSLLYCLCFVLSLVAGPV